MVIIVVLFLTLMFVGNKKKKLSKKYPQVQGIGDKGPPMEVGGLKLYSMGLAFHLFLVL